MNVCNSWACHVPGQVRHRVRVVRSSACRTLKSQSHRSVQRIYLFPLWVSTKFKTFLILNNIFVQCMILDFDCRDRTVPNADSTSAYYPVQETLLLAMEERRLDPRAVRNFRWALNWFYFTLGVNLALPV